MPPQLGQPQMPPHGQAPPRAVVEPTVLGHLLITTVCVFTTRSSPHLSPLGLSPRVLGFPSVLGLVLSP